MLRGGGRQQHGEAETTAAGGEETGTGAEGGCRAAAETARRGEAETGTTATWTGSGDGADEKAKGDAAGSDSY